MLIRFAYKKDLTSWYTLATEMTTIFQHPDDMGEDNVLLTLSR